MSIYDVNANLLSAVYGITGESVSSAYDLNGELIYPSAPVVDYDNYTAESMYRLTPLSNHTQGCAIYDGVIVAFRESNLMYTFNLSDGSTIASGISTISAHGGSASFSNEFYDENDRFPLIYVSSDSTEIYVNRITTLTSTLIRTLYFSTAVAGYYVKATVDATNNILYTVGYKENSYTVDSGTNNIIVSKWDLSSLTDNGDDTYTPAFISSYERDFIYVIQFVTFHDGMIWIGSGYGSPLASHVYAMNTSTGNILHDITLSDTVEIEGGAFVYDAGADSYYLIVLQWGGVFTKYTFGTT